MPWSERAKTVVVIELTVQSEENSDEVKQGYCLMWTAQTLGSVVSEESYKGTRRRGNREIVELSMEEKTYNL